MMTEEDKKIGALLRNATQTTASKEANQATRQRRQRERIMRSLPKRLDNRLITPNFIMMMAVWIIVIAFATLMQHELLMGYKALRDFFSTQEPPETTTIAWCGAFVVFVVFGLFETWQYSEE